MSLIVEQPIELTDAQLDHVAAGQGALVVGINNFFHLTLTPSDRLNMHLDITLSDGKKSHLNIHV